MLGRVWQALVRSGWTRELHRLNFVLPELPRQNLPIGWFDLARPRRVTQAVLGKMTGMSDTGEQGVTPGDPADRAGVGSGLVPDDLGEGRAQSEELEEHPPSEEAAKISLDEQGSLTPPAAAKPDADG